MLPAWVAVLQAKTVLRELRDRYGYESNACVKNLKVIETLKDQINENIPASILG